MEEFSCSMVARSTSTARLSATAQSWTQIRCASPTSPAPATTCSFKSPPWPASSMERVKGIEPSLLQFCHSRYDSATCEVFRTSAKVRVRLNASKFYVCDSRVCAPLTSVVKSLQSRIYRLTLQRQDAKDSFMHAA